MLVQVLRDYQGEMKQNEYARLLGLTSGALSLIYNGHRAIGIDTIHAFLRCFPDAAKKVGEAQLADARAAAQKVEQPA